MTLYDKFDKQFPGLLDCRDDFHVPPGWVDLVGRALAALAPTGARVLQVKEKFGGLRIYAVDAAEGHSWKPSWMKSLDFFERMSCLVCQECGTALAVTTGPLKTGRVAALCTGCRAAANS